MEEGGATGKAGTGAGLGVSGSRGSKAGVGPKRDAVRASWGAAGGALVGASG